LQYLHGMTTDADNTIWHDAVDTRDPAFDGVFFVAITSTRIYCRPVCPSRLARRENRRFFTTRTAAEAAGFRACKRCRPELERGNTPLDAVPRLAQLAVDEISGGALDGTSVKALAGSLGMTDRHLRRALAREVGASPTRIAVARRLRAATDLLRDMRQSITQVAYASGFQSLRRFNAVFREEFAMSPSEWRKRADGV
jgi:AraC family transcriptional regulator, regulatory protein of adaptative response / DNA-3-methyladenine glycosylase II